VASSGRGVSRTTEITQTALNNATPQDWAAEVLRVATWLGSENENNMDSQITRLNDAKPCGIIRDGCAMTMVRLEDAHAAATSITILEAHVAALTHDLATVTATKDRLLAEAKATAERIERLRAVFA
jgi:hypothetical protein